ncbi:hypothetical protein F4823DRAFT_616002 [Ustulina deusta]|nr:hypothetical protein F4823DRAFT_616002 [Ustulina deusta]
MLDQRHTDLPKPPNNYNIYTLGSISSYNIVVACFPKSKCHAWHTGTGAHSLYIYTMSAPTSIQNLPLISFNLISQPY